MMTFIFLVMASLILEPVSDLYRNVYFDTSNMRIIDSSFSKENGDVYLYVELNSGERNIVRIRENGETDRFDTIFLPDRHISRMVYLHGQQTLRFWDGGVGRVYDFNLLDLSWSRVDTSQNHRNQHSHAAYVDSSGTIYAMGGYGFWELKNIFSYFNTQDGQWYEMSALNREIVPRAMNGYLLNGGISYYYIVEKEQPAERLHVVFEYDVSNNIWNQNQSKSYLVKKLGLRKDLVVDQDFSYSIDQNRNRVALVGQINNKRTVHFLDYKEDKVYHIDPEPLGINRVRMVYYYKDEDKWVIFGTSLNVNESNILIARTLYLPDSLEGYPVTNATFWFVYPFRTLSAFGMVLVILMYPLYRKRHRIMTLVAKNDVNKKPIRIILDKGEPSEVIVANKKIDLLSDPLNLKFWKVVSEIEQNGGSILMVEFDEKLFGSSVDAPGRHRMRNRLFESVHEKLKSPLIIEKNSEYDKRVKVLHVNSDLIAIVN